MDYSLEDIVQLSGLSVDTIRCYQTLKLIPAPAHKGRKAVVDDRHRLLVHYTAGLRSRLSSQGDAGTADKA
jgi:hypothetical protein